MKWRNSIIYLVIFLLLGGYFYYFEVIKKEEKQTAEKESRKLFHFKTEDITSVEITTKDKGSVLLKKDGAWKIVEPIGVDVDKPSLDAVIAGLAMLDREREVDPAPTGLKPYGLEEPALKIRFLHGEKWHEILLGNKNPTGDSYFAKTGDTPSVVLVAAGNWTVLSKGVDDLRKRELLSFRQEDVESIHVAWQGGSAIDVREEQGGTWKAPVQPDMKIKKSKVDKLLETLKWLRAVKFLENDVGKLEPFGLNPALVTVETRFKGGRTSSITLGKKDKDDKQVAALSSELPAIVQVQPGILDEIPKDLRALEDRSLLSMKTEDVKRVGWRVGDARGQVTRLADSQWGFEKTDNEPKPLKESWHVRSLLWDVRDTEYMERMDPMPTPPESAHVVLELHGANNNLVYLIWEKTSASDKPVTVWIKDGDDSKAVQVEGKKIGKIIEDLTRLLKPEDGKDIKGGS